MIYHKHCKDPRCGKEFDSESRNQAFCSPECQARYYAERKKRRVKYKKHQVENQIASATYRVANLVADMVYPEKVCHICGAESTHVHHIDLNPLNNEPTNLVRLCEKCHKKVHSKLPNVNFIDALSETRENSKKVWPDETYRKYLEERMEGVDLTFGVKLEE